jgi:hypothetical protein
MVLANEFMADSNADRMPHRDHSKKIIVKGEDILPNIMIQHLFTSFVWFISRKFPLTCLSQGFKNNESEVKVRTRERRHPSNHELTRPPPNFSHSRLSRLLSEVERYQWGSRDDILLCIIPALSA